MKYWIREYKLSGGSPSYHNLASPSKLTMKIFIKESSCNLTPNLFIWIWNITKWREASSLFWFLNFRRHVFQSTLGMWFGKLGIWAWFKWAYLADKELMLTNEETGSTIQSLQPFDSGLTIGNSEKWILLRWSHHVKDAQPSWCLTVVHHQQSNMKHCCSYLDNFQPSFSDNGANLLALIFSLGCVKETPR